MKRRKRIGIIISHIDDIYQRKFIPGVLQHALELDYDCVIFSYSIKNSIVSGMLKGASNIFNLVNFKNIDAIIIVPDSIRDKTVLNSFIEIVQNNFKGPVVSADITFPYFKSILTDDASIIEKIWYLTKMS